jgi:hypothetical protein
MLCPDRTYQISLECRSRAEISMTEKHVASIPIGRLSMISIKECKIFAAEYKTLGCEPDIPLADPLCFLAFHVVG